MEFNDQRKLDIKQNQKIKEFQGEIDKVIGKSGFTSESAKTSLNNLESLNDRIKEQEFDKNRFLEK